MSKSYDVFLYTGCQTLPNLSDLAAHGPAITDPAVAERILHVPAPDQSHGPAPLWLDLPQDLAVALLDRLHQNGHGARGEVAPTSYRTPKYSLTMATRIVPSQTLLQFGLSAGGYRINTVSYQGQSARWYIYDVQINVVKGVFGALMRNGARPKSDVFTRAVCIDKVSGIIVDAHEYQKIMSDASLRR